MIVLKIIGWVLLGILALIVLALCVRVRIAVEYSDDNTNVLLQWLFIKYPLYPMQKKQPKQPKPEKEKPKKEKTKKEKPKKQSEPPAEADAPPQSPAGQSAQSDAVPETSDEKPARDEAEPEAPSGKPADTTPTADKKADGAQTIAAEAAPPEAATVEATAEEKTAEEASVEEIAAEEPTEEAAKPGEAAKPEDAEKQPEEAAKQPEVETKPAEKKESLLHMIYRTHGVDGILEIVRRVFSYLGSFLGDMMGALVIEELYLDIGCTRRDAAATAIYYGEVCSALFPMLGALAAKCKIKKYDINVYPDYLARFSRASFFVRFHLYPIYLIGITVVFGCRMLFKVLLRMLVKIFLHKKDKSAEKQNIKQEEKEDESHEGAVSGRNPVNND